MSELASGIANALGILVVLVGFAAYLTWIERRLLGFFQDRYGPNRVGPFGVFQVVADTIKILFKEDWVPPFADRAVFVLAPNSLMGGVRAAAQMVSYEVFMGLSLVGVVLMAGSFDLRDIVRSQQGLWYIVPQFLGFVVFLIAGIAETHRLPFDLPEAENELIAGFHTEYSGMKFGIFFIGEYVGIVLISAMIVTLFLGGWLGPVLPPLLWFLIKLAFSVGFFILLRAALPRPRYDQLMAYGWKVMLPLALLNIVVTGAVLLGA